MSVHLLSNAKLDVRETPVEHPSRPRKGAALRLVSTKDMARDDWLEVRRTGIGSSNAATAVGLNPYQSQLELWMQKTGKADQKWSRLFEQLRPFAKRDRRGHAVCICANGNAAKYASSGVAWLCA